MKNELIESIVTNTERQERNGAETDFTPRGVVVGTVTELNESGEPVVSFADALEPIVAGSILPITRNEIGKDAVLTFERGDLRKPIIIGILQLPKPLSREAQLDGERLVLTADKEIVLKCGESSITLTRAGKVLIRGAYLSTRSSGVNRIKGGSVQIN